MINCLKRNLSIIIVGIIVLVLIILNVKLDFIIMGADNASPYFNPIQILDRIKDTSAVIFGGIVFQVPFLQTLKLMGFSPELISNIYVFSNLFFGVIGIALIIRKQTKNLWATILGSIIFLTSLFTFFIFSQPNFLFMAAYGSIPILIYILSKNTLKWYHWILLLIFSLSFLTTTLNIVAFGLYLIQILIISQILVKDKNRWKRNLLWGILLVAIWMAVIQIIMSTNGDYKFFIVNIYDYAKDLLSNVYMPTVTSGILASEKTNSLIRTFQFALGWMELHNSNNDTIFEFYTTYRENFTYTLLGVIPFLLSLLVIIFKKSKKYLLLLLILFLFIFISSGIGMALIEKVPYLSSSLRWASSKLWPMYIIPITVLPSIVIAQMTKGRKLFAKLSLLIPLVALLCIYGYPVLNGHLISPKTLVNIPQVYFSLPQDSKILVLPHPQKLYMRDFQWGYYGSDFLSYINSSQIVDGANMYEYATEYEQIFETGIIPDDVQYVLYNTSAEMNIDEDQKQKSLELLDGLEITNSTQYFTLYEK